MTYSDLTSDLNYLVQKAISEFSIADSYFDLAESARVTDDKPLRRKFIQQAISYDADAYETLAMLDALTEIRRSYFRS